MNLVAASWNMPNWPGNWFSGIMYKQVDQKVKPVARTFLEFSRVIRQFPKDLLLSLLILTPNPSKFKLMKRISEERMKMLLIDEEEWL